MTIKHELDLLKAMHDEESHIVAKHEGRVVGYALVMSMKFRNEIDVIKSLFVKLQSLLDDSTTYVVMGQICIDKVYRRQGIFKGLYREMQQQLSHKYDVVITGISAKNSRSLSAHKAVGFTDLLMYEDNGKTWHIVQWNWRQ